MWVILTLPKLSYLRPFEMFAMGTVLINTELVNTQTNNNQLTTRSWVSTKVFTLILVFINEMSHISQIHDSSSHCSAKFSF